MKKLAILGIGNLTSKQIASILIDLDFSFTYNADEDHINMTFELEPGPGGDIEIMTEVINKELSSHGIKSRILITNRQS